jgi:hypothetical protein
MQQALTNAKSGCAQLPKAFIKVLSIVMIAIIAQLIAATPPADNANTLLLTVTTTMLAQMILAIKPLDVFTPTTFVMTIILAQSIPAMLQKDASILQWFAPITMLAQQTLA